MTNASSFSSKMMSWLSSPGKKTLHDLENVFAEKGFAVACLILMAPAALPIPTGGITHIFELIVMLLALELIVGRKSIWLPKKWKSFSIGQTLEKKALPKLARLIAWFEKRSKPRLQGLLKTKVIGRFYGITILILALAAFLAPPFSGLDTLPALGAVIVCLSLLFDDALILIVGMAVGTAGIIAQLTLGSFVFRILG